MSVDANITRIDEMIASQDEMAKPPLKLNASVPWRIISVYGLEPEHVDLIQTHYRQFWNRVELKPVSTHWELFLEGRK